MRQTVQIAAHRGNSAVYPENTMAAFRSALTLDVDMIENDVHITADGELVVMHDPTVDRTTNGTGLIREKTLAEIKALDAGSWKDPRFAGEQVTTFVEFLELVKDRADMQFNIELKDYPSAMGQEAAFRSADKTLALMEAYGIAERSVINSWSGELLEYVDGQYHHKYRLHGYHPFFQMGKMERNPYDFLSCMCLFNAYLDQEGHWRLRENPVSPIEAFQEAQTNGVEPWVYYPHETREIIEQAVTNGARLITSNTPQATLEILRSLGVHR